MTCVRTAVLEALPKMLCGAGDMSADLLGRLGWNVAVIVMLMMGCRQTQRESRKPTWTTSTTSV
jgi:hypothetical protein